MTTLTEPPLIAPPAIPDDVLERLLDDTERVCELIYYPTDRRCARLAVWVVSVRCENCATVRTALLCADCRRSLMRHRVHHRPCGIELTLIRCEPLRSPP